MRKISFGSEQEMAAYVAKYVADVLASQQSPEHSGETLRRMRQTESAANERSGLCIEESEQGTLEFSFTRTDGRKVEIGYPSLAFFVLQYVADSISDEDIDIRVSYGQSLPGSR